MLRADDYGALEPAISGQIMELHHSKHHNTYVTSFNTASEKMEEARAKNDIQTQIATQPLINFHGGKTSAMLLFHTCITDASLHRRSR